MFRGCNLCSKAYFNTNFILLQLLIRSLNFITTFQAIFVFYSNLYSYTLRMLSLCKSYRLVSYLKRHRIELYCLIRYILKSKDSDDHNEIHRCCNHYNDEHDEEHSSCILYMILYAIEFNVKAKGLLLD